MQELAQDEVSSLSPKIAELEGQLKLLLLPKDPLDEKNIVLEVHAKRSDGLHVGLREFYQLEKLNEYLGF